MPSTENGIVTIKGRASVTETVEKLQAMLREKGITLFTLVDHSGEAEKIGMTMPDTKLLIFGSPQAGTPLMLASPEAALDLPLKLLVRDEGQGRTSLSYNSAEYLLARHHLPAEFSANIAAVAALAENAAR